MELTQYIASYIATYKWYADYGELNSFDKVVTIELSAKDKDEATSIAECMVEEIELEEESITDYDVSVVLSTVNELKKG